MNWTIVCIIHILSFITPNFLLNCVIYMAALLIFWTWVWVGMGVDMFLLDLCVKNILAMKSTCSGCMLASGWLLHCVLETVRVYKGLKQAGRKTGSEWHTKALYRDLVDENISIMNKYSWLYWVSVRSFVCRAQTAGYQACSLDNIFLHKISYKR